MSSLLYFTAIYSLTVLICVTTIFLLSRLRDDNTIMDLGYGLVFIIATWFTIFLTLSYHPISYLTAIMVTLWGTRLSSRLIIKHIGKPEDPRYGAWRELWLKKGRLYFILRSYLQINLFQGILIVIISLPVILIISNPETVLLPWLVAGTLVWMTGLAIETIADKQLDNFLKRKREGLGSEVLMKEGLFRYSRRPNYFGESLVWFGLAIVAVSTPLGWLGLMGAFTITFIVTRITGPMLENIFLKQYPEEYQAYMRTTSYFIPLPPKVDNKNVLDR